MKTKIPGTVSALFVFAVVISGLTLFMLVPLHANIQSQRNDIDAVRTSIAALTQQQRNIEVVSRNFSELTRKDEEVASVFLTEPRSVAFFDELDALGDRHKIGEMQKRLDDPNDSAGDQLLGFQISFTADYQSTLAFLRELLQTSVYISPSDISISRATRPGLVSVTIESQLPWTSL